MALAAVLEQMPTRDPLLTAEDVAAAAQRDERLGMGSLVTQNSIPPRNPNG